MSRLRLSTIAGIVTLALAAGCGGGSTGPNPPPPPPPPPPPTVAVAPPTLSLVIGATGQLTATISNGTGTINWSTSAAGVATVSQTGLVTAAGVGNATITAALAGGTATGTSAITVTAPPVSIGVLAVTQNGQPVTLTAAKNNLTFEINLVVPAGFNGQAQVLLGGKVAGSRPIVNGVPAGPIQVGPETAAETSNGMIGTTITAATTPVDVIGSEVIERFSNTDFASLLRVIDANQNVVASAAGPTIGLTNDTKMVLIDGRLVGPTADRDGRTYGTELELKIGSANYGKGDISQITAGQVERIEVLTGPAATAVYGGVAVNGVIDIILRKNISPASGGTMNIGEGRFGLTTATAVTPLGTGPIDILNNDPIAGTNLIVPQFNLDGLAPAIPADKSTFEYGSGTAWLNANTPLANRLLRVGMTWTGTSPTVIDEGVGGVTCDLRYSTNGGSTFFPTVVTKGSDAGSETASPNLAFRIYCRDALGQEGFRPITNGITTTYQQVGLDFTVPVLAFQNSRGAENGITGFHINPVAATPLFFSATDPGTGSGLSSVDPYRVKVLRDFEGATDLEKCFVGTVMSGMCVGLPLSLDRYVTTFPAGPGEYELKVGVEDRAFNFSGYQSRWVIKDVVPPVASDLTLDATLTAGVNFNVGFKLTDDWDLSASAVAIRYNNVTTAPILKYQQQGAPFDAVWKKSVSLQYNLKYPASLERLTQAGSGFYVPSGVEQRATDLLTGGADNAGLAGFLTTPIGPRSTYDPAWQSFKVGANGLDRIEFVDPLVRVCNNPYGVQGNCQGVPESFNVRIDAYYPTGGVNRIDQMYLAKATSVQGVQTALLFDQPMTRTRQTFSGFYLDRYSQTVTGQQFRAGSYDMTFYGLDLNWNMLEGRRVPFTVTEALRQ